MTRFLALLVWVLVNAGLSPTAYAEQIASYQGLTASISDTTSCGTNITVDIVASNATAYKGDRLGLQYLIGSIRANFAGCPKLKSILLNGHAGGLLVFQGRVSSQDGWRLAVNSSVNPRVIQGNTETRSGVQNDRNNPRPIGTSQGIACDNDPQQPLVGCWFQISPASPPDLRPAITVFTQDGRMFGGTPRSLANGQMTGAANWRRKRMYGFGQIVDVKRDAGGFQQFLPPSFYDQCSIMDLPSYGFEALLPNLFGPPIIFRMIRLNVRRLTAEMFDDERELSRLGRIIAQGSKQDFCIDPGQPSLVDRILINMEKQILSEMGKTTLLIPSLAPRVQSRMPRSRSTGEAPEREPQQRPMTETISPRPSVYYRPEPWNGTRGRFAHEPIIPPP